MQQTGSIYIKTALSAALLGFSVPTAAGDMAGDAKSSAASFNVTPLRLSLASDEHATRMLVRNGANRPMAVQVRLFRWTQIGGKDVYAPSRDIAISPSIIKIGSGDTQTFHIVGQRHAANSAEQQYRIVIDQLPDRSVAPSGMAKTMLRMTLPLFVNSDKVAPAKLAYTLSNGALHLRNSGGATARVSRVMLTSPQFGALKVPAKGPLYVMSGSTIRVPLPAGARCDAADIRITGVIDKKNFDAAPAQNCT